MAALDAGKHLLGEKPFGIDLAANETITAAVNAHPDQLVRCSSEMPFFPGGQAVWRWIAAGEFGRPIEVRSLFLHSSDLDPGKPAGWKRRAETNGAYGCPRRPRHARLAPAAAGPLGAARRERRAGRRLHGAAGRRGGTVPCDTPDNAVLLCRAEHEGDEFLCESRPSASPPAT